MVENGGTSGVGTVPNPVVAGWVDQLNELVQACADDAALVDLVSSLESLKGASAGAQAAATVVFAASQTAIGAAAKTRPEIVRRSVCGQVALARRDSAHRGGRHVGLALALHSELPHTREALAAGRISEWQATLICRETACLDPALRREADARLAGQLGSLGDAGVAREAARAVAELDPAAVAERAAKAARDRRVTVRPAPDTMAYLTALLPAANAVACFAALNAYASLAVGEGDGRGRGQIMADALTDRLTGGAITGCDDAGRPIRAEQEAEPAEPGAGEADSSEAESAGPDATSPEPDRSESDQAEAADPSESKDAESDRAEDGSTEPRPAEDRLTEPGPIPQGGAEREAEAAAGQGNPSDGDPQSRFAVTRPAVVDPVAALRAGRSDHAGVEVRCTCSCPCQRCQAAESWRYRFPTVRELRKKLRPGPRPALRFNVNVIMSDRTLWGHSDEPGDVVGYGPIPADLARDLVAADLGPDVKTFLRRFYADPDTGQLAAMDSTARFFSTNMKQFMLVRDRECRTPYCHAPARHADHGDDHAGGGPTDVDANGNCRCEQCNHTKQAPGWRVVNCSDGAIVTTTPTGHSYQSPPPTPPGASPPTRERPDPQANKEVTAKPKAEPGVPATTTSTATAKTKAATTTTTATATARVRAKPEPKPWIVRADRAAGLDPRPWGSGDERPQRSASAGFDLPCPELPLDVVDLTSRFPNLDVEYCAA